MLGRLEGKVTLITGAAHGIGLATAKLFLREGALAVGADIDEAGLTLRAEELGGRFVPVATDVTSPDSVKAMVAVCMERFGRIDALVHYAGITRDAVHWKMSLEDWELVLRVNLTGSFLVASAVADVMRQQRSGSIVLTSSRSYLGNFGQANYAASKGGVVSLTRTLALELGRYNVRVNALVPGFIETRMTEAVPPELRERTLSLTPLARAGRPEEVAYAALFLASDEASFITGHTLFVDGGRTVGLAMA